MSRVCFGQNFEDVVLWRGLGHVGTGCYLDIGAQHPEIDSVSLSFYREGWRGVHVEPTPQYAALLREKRPDEVFVEAAVGDGSGLLEFYVFPDTGLSTGSVNVSAQHSAAGLQSQKITVPIVSLESLLDQFVGQDLHWLKIDVEGMEQSVLRSWGQSSVRPWVVLLEAIEPTSQNADELLWRDLIEKRDYHEVLFDGVNRFFVANERANLDVFFNAPANCLDRFYVPWHHWSAANVVHQFRIEAAESASELEKLSNRLSVQASDLERIQKSNQDLFQLSRSLASQLDAAHTNMATLIANYDGHLRSAFAQMNAMREQIAMMAEEVAEKSHRLQIAASIVNISSRQLASWPLRVIQSVTPAGRKNRRGLKRAIKAWAARATLFRTPANQLENSEASRPMDIFAFEQRNPHLRADSIEELCSFSDADFVRCAYVTILGRQSDPDGERRYVAQLRSGTSKLGVIADLRQSNEGQRHDPGIAGLDKRLKAYRNANRPFIGWLIRMLTGHEGNSQVERRLRALTHMLELEQNRAGARAATANQWQLVLDEKVDALHKELRSALAGQSTSPRQIGQAEAAGGTEWETTLHSVLNG